MDIPKFDSVSILVVGDVMLDRYWYGDTQRISPEAPVPVVRVGDREERLGGAANVALNLAHLGVETSLLGLVGRDEAATSIKRLLDMANIKDALLTEPGIHTITKLRIMSRHQQLIRLDFEDKQLQAPAKLQEEFSNQLAQHDVVVFSDYAKGTLKEVKALIGLAKQAGKVTVVDPKGADFSIYQGASVITPNFKEFSHIVGPCDDEEQLVEKGQALCQQLQLQSLLVTRGEQGMSLLRQNESFHLETQAKEVFDVTGAGDTVVAVLAASLAVRQDWTEAVSLANLAAGIVVGKLGTATVSRDELQLAIHQHLHPYQGGIYDIDSILPIVQAAKSRGERLVMSNGCFDIVHAGHVDYLTKAKALGDRLIIAVNTDESVKRLKGASRPIVPLQQRMELLAALGVVDWVVPFSQDTPEKLIGKILPHILVKGEDYKPEDIAGYESVTQAGGQVLTLQLTPGVSTSDIIKRIRAQKSE